MDRRRTRGGSTDGRARSIVTGSGVGEPDGLAAQAGLFGGREEELGRQARQYLMIADRGIARVHEQIESALAQTAEPDGVGVAPLRELKRDDVAFAGAMIVEPSRRPARPLQKRRECQRAIGEIQCLAPGMMGGRSLKRFPEIVHGSHLGSPRDELEAEAAVQLKNNTIHEAIPIQAIDRVCKLIHGAETPDWRALGMLLQHFRSQRAPRRADIDEARRYRVDPNTERTQFLRQRSGEAFDTGLRRTVLPGPLPRCD